MASKLDSIHTKLTDASALLDAAARELREGTGMGDEAIAQVGKAMAEITFIRHRIYLLRPDLMPAYLTGEMSGETSGETNKD
jgi:hypothetical protein